MNLKIVPIVNPNRIRTWNGVPWNIKNSNRAYPKNRNG